MNYSILHTPWKINNELLRLLILPFVRFQFVFYDIPWNKGWRFYGVPIIQKHRKSMMGFGSNFQLRSSVRSNPLGPNHPVILCTWQEDAELRIGDNFGMTGGVICTTKQIIIGNNVTVGANVTIIDTDFHPVDLEQRRLVPNQAKPAPVLIEDDVFIGTNVLVLKGVKIGKGSVIGAGSVVTQDIPARSIAAGNPAKIIAKV